MQTIKQSENIKTLYFDYLELIDAEEEARNLILKGYFIKERNTVKGSKCFIQLERGI